VTISKDDIQGHHEYASVDIEVLPVKNIPESNNKEIVAAYFPWFSERFSQPPPRPQNCEDWSIFTPTIKPYDPQSKEVLEQHIRMAKDAGIDAFVVSWFPERTWGDYDLIMKPAMENLVTLSQQMDFRIYILYDPAMSLCKWNDQGFIPIQTESEVQQAQIDAETDFKYLMEQLSAIEDYPAFYLYMGTVVGLSQEDWQPVLANVRAQYPAARFYMDTRNMEYLTTCDGIFDWVASFDEAQMNQYPTEASGVKCYGDDKRFYATVSPGFDSTLFWGSGPLLVPREDGAYYRHTLGKALDSHADGIFIATWNEWGESTIIEPSKEYGYQYIDITADAAIEFKSQEVATPHCLVCGHTITKDTVLDEDLMCSPDTQFAIVIGASDITLDLGGHVISGYAPTSGIGGIGILAVGVKGLTIKNGTIEGFNRGIFVSETDSVTIENLTIRNQNVIDINHLITGIAIDGSQNIVVRDMLFEFPLQWHKDAVEVYNSNVTISNIEVHGGNGVIFSFAGVCDPVHAPSNGSVLNSQFLGMFGVGIWIGCTSSVRIAGNEITTAPPGQGVGIGVDASFLGAVTGLTVEGNYIHDAAVGIDFCGATQSTISNNIVSGNSAWGIALQQSSGCLSSELGLECFCSMGNTIIDNQTSGNGIDLYHDEECVGNIWEGNTYETKEGSDIP
jgi:parallel beta-helix repeat protein